MSKEGGPRLQEAKGADCMYIFVKLYGCIGPYLDANTSGVV